MVDAAMSLFRCGNCTDGISSLREAFATGRDLGMLSSLIDASSMLAWMYRIVQEDPEYEEWDRVSDRLYQEHPVSRARTSHYLSNKIEFAIELGRPADARRWLEHAKAGYSEITTPRSRILALAFRLRIHQLEGTDVDTSVATASELEIEHARGKRCGLHDNFAEAYWWALSRSGRIEDADAMLSSYLAGERRDRFPLGRSLLAIVSQRKLPFQQPSPT